MGCKEFFASNRSFKGGYSSIIMEEYMIFIWLALLVVALIVEACTSELVSIWFASGALVSLILSAIPNIPWWVELIAFLSVSIALLFAVRPLTTKALKHSISKSNIDEIVGKNGIVVEEISELNMGLVKINGILWNAIPTENQTINKDEIIIVAAVEGNKLIVKNSKEKEN